MVLFTDYACFFLKGCLGDFPFPVDYIKNHRVLNASARVLFLVADLLPFGYRTMTPGYEEEQF